MSDSTPTIEAREARAREAAIANAEALIAEVRDIAGDLPEKWAHRAREIGEKAVALVGLRVRGKITDAQFADLRDDLVRWTKAEVAIGLGDAYAKRIDVVLSTVPILVRMVYNIASGRPIF